MIAFPDELHRRDEALAADSERLRNELDDLEAAVAALERALEDRTRALRAAASALATVEERERRQLARDLHDHLAQLLSVALLKIELLARSTSDATSRRSLHEVGELVDEAGRAARSLVFQLSPAVLDELGLVPALQWLAAEMRRAHGLAVEIADDGEPKPLGRLERSILFRAVRELLINVAKHAQQDAARVEARRDGTAIVLTVEDGGTGFDPEAVMRRHPAGFGLASVRERLRFIGGGAEIASRPGSGTVVTLTAPLHAGDAAEDVR